MKLTSSTMSSFGFFLLYSIIFLCIGLPTVGSRSILGNETDRLSLLAFKDQINHDPLQVMGSWNLSLHFCKWQGVTCSRRHQRVVMLNLKSQGLVGSMSPSIGNLSFLRIIKLQNNNFQDEIPQEVGRLFRLQMFNMYNNSFVGEIPVNLSHCSNLKILNLGFNKLVGNIPIEIASLSKLVVLSFNINNLTGGIPTSFGNLSSLEVFSLAGNSLEGSIPESIGQLKNLKILSLGTNSLAGMIPHSLYNLSFLEIYSMPLNQLTGSLPLEIGLTLPNLRFFLMGGNQFFGSIPVSLFNASRLEKLELTENNFTGNVPVEIGKLKGLTHLIIQYNHLGSGKVDDLNFINSLTNSTNLQVLDIINNRFGGKLSNSIANLSNQLSELGLSGNEISGSIPSEIGNLANLISLTMSTNFLTGSIPNGIGMLHKLQVLYLDENKFSGQIPSSLGNMSQIYDLRLSDNIFEGKILDISKCHFLQILDLSKNKLNGTIPKQIIGLSSQLIDISLAHNSLTGSLPLEVGNLKNLKELDVSENKISGDIPSTLGSCLSMEYLYLQDNLFQGPIPSYLSALKGIQEIDLSKNNLSGQIPKDLEYLSFLKKINVSFNDLDGEVPIKGVFQNTTAFSIVGNSKLCGGIPELQLHMCPIKKSKKQGASHHALKVIIGVILPLVVVASFLLLYWRRKPSSKPSSALFLGEWYKRISYNGLYKATEGFAESNLIGAGNFGSVYKGVLHQGEILVAVKVLNLMERGAFKSFINECKALRKVRHRNLLKILTVCSSVDSKGNDFKALVFKFMPNGNLENWLHPSSDEQYLSRNLNLCQRLNIAIDIASALDYLHNHCQTPIVHCDLKPSNVLLDTDLTAVVGDFGLAKFLTMTTNNSEENNTSSISIKGTIGYIPREYGVSAEVSKQGDVYSFGILLLELITGKRPTDNMFKDGLSLHHFSKMALNERVMEIMDPRLLLEEDDDRANYDHENQRSNTMDKMRKCLISIITIGVACSMESLGERMDINDVLVELHIIKEVFLGIGIHGQRRITS